MLCLGLSSPGTISKPCFGYSDILGSRRAGFPHTPECTQHEKYSLYWTKLYLCSLWSEDDVPEVHMLKSSPLLWRYWEWGVIRHGAEPSWAGPPVYIRVSVYIKDWCKIVFPFSFDYYNYSLIIFYSPVIITLLFYPPIIPHPISPPPSSRRCLHTHTPTHTPLPGLHIPLILKSLKG